MTISAASDFASKIRRRNMDEPRVTEEERDEAAERGLIVLSTVFERESGLKWLMVDGALDAAKSIKDLKRREYQEFAFWCDGGRLRVYDPPNAEVNHLLEHGWMPPPYFSIHVHYRPTLTNLFGRAEWGINTRGTDGYSFEFKPFEFDEILTMNNKKVFCSGLVIDINRFRDECSIRTTRTEWCVTGGPE